jgi:hypothetical protein
MTTTVVISHQADHWLKHYYALRALFSEFWVALAFTIGRSQPSIAAALKSSIRFGTVSPIMSMQAVTVGLGPIPLRRGLCIRSCPPRAVSE